MIMIHSGILGDKGAGWPNKLMLAMRVHANCYWQITCKANPTKVTSHIMGMLDAAHVSPQGLPQVSLSPPSKLGMGHLRRAADPIVQQTRTAS